MQERDYGSGIKSYSMTGDEALKFLDQLKGKATARDSVNEGAQLFMAGDYTAAEAKFKEAIATNPQNAVAHGNIGNIYFKRKQYQDAIPWLEKALALDTNIEGVAECLRECRAQVRPSPVVHPKPSPLPPSQKKAWWQFWK
jgi:tetratricopeptide (TPR) repeat protein